MSGSLNIKGSAYPYITIITASTAAKNVGSLRKLGLNDMKKYHKITNFYDAWWFLVYHPSFMEDFGKGYKDNAFERSLDIHVAKICPKTNRIEDDEKKNTKTQVWLEAGKWMTAKECTPKHTKIPDDYYGSFSHDYDLDCGGDTFEEAVITLAKKVMKHYGDYKPES